MFWCSKLTLREAYCMTQQCFSWRKQEDPFRYKFRKNEGSLKRMIVERIQG